jgi:GT2 family glycosyltransferase
MNEIQNALSIIIVNWNSREYLQKCIESIFLETKGILFEIIVVDNASYDGSEEMIRKKFPPVKYIQSNINIGFASANNSGVNKSNGKYLLFLNPDTIVLDNALCKLYEALVRKNGGAAGCRLLNTDLSLQTSCIMPYPTICNTVLDIEPLRLKTWQSNFWGIAPMFRRDAFPVSVQAVSGACLMVERKAFEKINGFCEDYFMYAEDIDLCYRLNSSGTQVYYLDSAAVIHHGGGSTNNGKPGKFSTIQMRQSRFLFFQKYKSRYYASKFKFTMAIFAFVRMSISIILLPLYFFNNNMSSWYAMNYKWYYIARWSLGIE